MHSTNNQHSQIVEHTFRRKDFRSEIGLLPAQKLLHNFEQNINEHNSAE